MAGRTWQVHRLCILREIYAVLHRICFQGERGVMANFEYVNMDSPNGCAQQSEEAHEQQQADPAP